MYLKYAIKQINRRPLMNLIVIIQFVAVIILISATISRLNSYFVVSETIEEICSENSYKINWDNEYSNNAEDILYDLSEKFNQQREEIQVQFENGKISESEYQDKLNMISSDKEKAISDAGLENVLYSSPDISLLPYVKKRYTYYNSNAYIGDDMDIGFVSEDMSQALDIKLSSGSWFTDTLAEDEDPTLKLITTDVCGYNTGDIVDVYIYSYNGTKEYTEKYCKGRIVGLIDYDKYKETVENAKFESNDYISFDDVFPIDSEMVLAVFDKDETDFSCEIVSDIVRLNEGLSDKERSEFHKTVAQNKYYALDMTKVYRNTYNRDRKNFSNDLVFIVLSFMIAAISLVSVCVLNISTSTRAFAVYRMCGLSTDKLMILNCIYTLIILLISLCIAISGIFISAVRRYHMVMSAVEREINIPFSHFLSFGISEIIIVLIFLTVSFIISEAISYKLLNKKDTISDLRNE